MHVKPQAAAIRAFKAQELQEAERRFVAIKARILRAVTGEKSLMRARHYLRSIEDVLADMHEARRRRGRGRRELSVS